MFKFIFNSHAVNWLHKTKKKNLKSNFLIYLTEITGSPFLKISPPETETGCHSSKTSFYTSFEVGNIEKLESLKLDGF